MVTSPVFQHLFTPFTIGSMTVRNRIVVPGHGTGFMPPADYPPNACSNTGCPKQGVAWV
jgi:2,4-dienoyl-CoA reductase-like NADH-dependent reductase (Old Yellow Enzyme family)